MGAYRSSKRTKHLPGHRGSSKCLQRYVKLGCIEWKQMILYSDGGLSMSPVTDTEEMRRSPGDDTERGQCRA